MQPIPDTAPTDITEEPKRVLNPGIGNRRERGRCPRYWGIVLGLSEGAIYVRRPPKGIDEGSKDLKGSQRSSRVVEGASEVFGISVRVHTSLARVVEVGDGSGSADEGPEALSSGVGMTGHVRSEEHT